MRIAVCEVRHLDELEDLENAWPDRRTLHLPYLQREREVVEHGHVRPDGVRLEHDAEVAPLGGDVDPPRRVVEEVAADGNSALLGCLKAGDRHQRRRLATPAWAEQCEELALANMERDIVERAVLRELLDEGLDMDLRHRHDLPSRGS